MFRRVASCAAKMVVGFGSVQFGVAAVALTDKELSKKPEWYKNSVLRLEDSIKATSKKGFIESETVLNEAEDVFQRVVDLNNPEILWRLARTLTEKAELVQSHSTKAKLLNDAVDLAKRAIESGKSSAGAHKWYAIALERLIHVDKKAKKNASTLHEKIWDNLKRATELDSNDPYAWHLLGVAAFYKKDWKDAVGYFQKAESVKKDFSASNLYYLGEAQRHAGNKNEAIETLKNTLRLPGKYKADNKARSDAKRSLLVNLKLKPEEIAFTDDI
ncbi:hypothetical protein M3Y94_00206300 [Aphelenchoides besseyi]|nr:hypothetical protein M3Y94_00206300 [Aphelenchoides besseyi]KAI6236665.1 Regulator of microtubule dynamics protein 1 [Aphelenchoides besseyi]